MKQLGNGRDWAASAYLAFASTYHQMLTANVANLAKFTTRVGTEYFEIHIPQAAVIADAMVNQTMLELANRGGSYYAVSDAATWVDLPNFREAQKAEKRKRVHIQRIFVLGKPADDVLKLKDVASILVEHYDNARSSAGKYEMCITDTHEYSGDSMAALGKTEHFGIFHPDNHDPIVFSVHDKNMSQFTVRAASNTMISEFQSVWRGLEDLKLTDPDASHGDRVIRDYLLAYSIRRLPDGSGYRGVSKIKTWQKGAFRRFLNASERAINNKQITIRRLLVFDEDDVRAFDEVVGLLLEHDGLCRKTGSRYQWRLSTIADWSPAIAEEISFGIFDDASPADRIVTDADVSVEGRPFVKAIDWTERQRFSEAFNDVWTKKAKSWRQSIENVFGEKASDVIAQMKWPPNETPPHA